MNKTFTFRSHESIRCKIHLRVYLYGDSNVLCSNWSEYFFILQLYDNKYSLNILMLGSIWYLIHDIKGFCFRFIYVILLIFTSDFWFNRSGDCGKLSQHTWLMESCCDLEELFNKCIWKWKYLSLFTNRGKTTRRSLCTSNVPYWQVSINFAIYWSLMENGNILVNIFRFLMFTMLQ